MPIQTPAVPVGDPGHYKFLFPIRPGETQFGIIFTLPYSGSLKITPKIAAPVTTFAVLVPKSMKIKPGPSSPLQLSPDPSNTSADTYVAQNVSPSQPLEFTVSGLGQLPRDADQGSPQPSGDGTTVAATDNKMPGKGLDNPLDPNGDRDVWGKYKWWILFGLAALLVVAAAFLVRKPATPAVTAAAPAAPLEPATRSSLLLASLKEEMFALETDRLQNRISDADYAAQKAALELILRRALERSQPAPPPASPSTLA
jgi:hypothetical protein